MKKTRKALQFSKSESSDSKLFDLSATPKSYITKNSNHDNVNVSKFEAEGDEVNNSKEDEPVVEKAKAKSVIKRKTTCATQNMVRQNLKGGYQQKDRRIKMRNSKALNKRKKILDERYNNMRVRANGVHGGFGREGLDGAYISDMGIKSKIVPTFSPKYTDDYIKPEPLKVPKTEEEYLRVLKEYFGFEMFFEGQLEAIKGIIERKESVLTILSTGGGKSLIYQYCSLFMRGLVIVITPLISLMTDQLNKLPMCISGACFNSYQNFVHKKKVIEALTNNKISVLFMSPERLVVEDLSRYKQEVSMVCIDEIHCSSEWSHNFRPSYLKLGDIIPNRFNCDIILGLTATATRDTEKALAKEFNIQNVIRSNDLSRMNLCLTITRDEDNTKMQNLVKLLKSDDYK